MTLFEKRYHLGLTHIFLHISHISVCVHPFQVWKVNKDDCKKLVFRGIDLCRSGLAGWRSEVVYFLLIFRWRIHLRFWREIFVCISFSFWKFISFYWTRKWVKRELISLVLSPGTSIGIQFKNSSSSTTIIKIKYNGNDIFFLLLLLFFCPLAYSQVSVRACGPTYLHLRFHHTFYWPW